MKSLLQKLFDIREGEWQKALLMFLYIFLVIASLLIIKPVRNSLFLTHYGIKHLPTAYIFVAISAVIITKVYSLIVKKYPLNFLIFYTNILSILSLSFFWLLLFFDYKAGWVYFTFYVWVALFGAISTSQFWLLANYVFNAREAKRLFGFVGAGAISGGIFGGYLTKFLASLIGTSNMIFFCIIFLIICIYILKIVWKTIARYTYKERLLQEKRIQSETTQTNTFKLILKSRHLSYIAGIIGISVIVANLVDYQFSAIASSSITKSDELTAFFGFWLSNLSIASLLIQLFLTSRILKLFGVIVSLLFLPSGILIGTVLILLNPSLFSAIMVKVGEGSFKQSINKSGIELLIMPIPNNLKNQAKSFIDIFIDSLATGIGGILLIIFTHYFHFSIPQISTIVFCFIIMWYGLIKQVKKEYLNSFRSALKKRSIDPNFQNINIEDASIFESITKVFDGSNEKQILYALELIENLNNEKLVPCLQKSLQHTSDDVKIKCLSILDQYKNFNLSENISDFIYHENFEVKVQAMRYLIHRSSNFENLFSELIYNHDFKIQNAALLCAAYENVESKEFRSAFAIKKIFNDFIDKCCNEEENDIDINFMKANIARVIGIAKNEDLYPYLKNLLYEKNFFVLRMAITNAGSTRDPIFMDSLIQRLNLNYVRNYTREALAEYGEDVIDKLESYLINPKVSLKIKLEIPKTLALIGSQNSVNLLLKNLNQENIQLKYHIIKALNKLKVKFPHLKFDKNYINNHIFSETKHYYQILCSLYMQNSFTLVNKNQSSNNSLQAKNLLIKALDEKLDQNLERIFRLLGLRYIPKDMYNSYLGVVSEKSDLRANAVEFLDNVLDGELKKIIIPFVEKSAPNTVINQTQHFFGNDILSVQKSFHFLLEGNDDWLKACALFFISQQKLSQYLPIVNQLLNDDDPMIKETALLCKNNLENVI